MTQEAASIFELIRREGLIVVAIAALAWQVYWLTTQASAEDTRWREELAAYREAADMRVSQRLEATRDLTEAVTRMYDRLASIETTIEDIEEGCRVLDVLGQRREHQPPEESRR